MTKTDYAEIVSRRGKFEGEPACTPYFYDLVMDGSGEPVYDDPADSDDADTTLLYDVFTIDGSDIELFPELEEHLGRQLCIWENTQGFVVSKIV